MKILLIEEDLKSLSLRVEHLMTPQLKAKAMLHSLEKESQRCNSEQFAGAQTGISEVCFTMNKYDKIAEIDISIALLEHFCENSNFELAAISSKKSQNLLDKFNKIKAILKHAIEG
jgi:hypothetical protein